jgi:DNA-binding MarR family transcriptional regulator
MSDDTLLPAERKVQEVLGGRDLDFRAMGALSNLFRSAVAIRRHLEATVLAPHRLSWTSFVGLWVLWVWGELGANTFAEAVGISRPTATGVIRTLESRGWATRRGDERDRRSVLVRLTPAGLSLIEELFPRFNQEETRVVASLEPEQQDELAALLRRLLLGVTAPRN